jgi:hypothetical protein
MKTLSRFSSKVPTPLVLALGAVLGFWCAFRLREEEKRRIRKALRELKELPFRLLV